jgi:hypothetical protein
LLEGHRIVRGTFVSKVKYSMFKAFREFNLPPISTKFDNLDIRRWKANPAVSKCYSLLFKKINPSEPDTYMSKILDITWKDRKSIPKIQIAFVISICEVLLNPNNLVVTISEEAVKPTLQKNIVSF